MIKVKIFHIQPERIRIINENENRDKKIDAVQYQKQFLFSRLKRFWYTQPTSYVPNAEIPKLSEPQQIFDSFCIF
jgi:hypothetical protein